MPRDDRTRRRPRDDEDDDRPRRRRDEDDDDDEDDRPRKKKSSKPAEADPEKMYLLIGGGVAALLLIAVVVYFAVRPARKAGDGPTAPPAGGTAAAGAGSGPAPAPGEVQDANTITLTNLRRTAKGEGGEAVGKLVVDYAFNVGWPSETGTYVLVIETDRETKELDLGKLTERKDTLDLNVSGRFARNPAKVWIAYKAAGQTGAGKVVSNVLTADPPAADEGDESKP